MKEILGKVSAANVNEFWQIARERCEWSYDQMANRRKGRIPLSGAERTVLEQIAAELADK